MSLIKKLVLGAIFCVLLYLAAGEVAYYVGMLILVYIALDDGDDRR